MFSDGGMSCDQMRSQDPNPFLVSQDCQATFDFLNCPLQTGRPGIPWKVGNVAPVSATRAPAPGHIQSVANRRFRAVCHLSANA